MRERFRKATNIASRKNLINLAAAGIAIAGVGAIGSGCEIRKTDATPTPIEQNNSIEKVNISEFLDNPQAYFGKLVEIEGVAKFMGQGPAIQGFRLFEPTEENIELVTNWPEHVGKHIDEIPTKQDSSERGRFVDLSVYVRRDFSHRSNTSDTTSGIDLSRRYPLIKTGFNSGYVNVIGFVDVVSQSQNWASMTLENPQTDKIEVTKELK